jgi:NADH-quinone oxidoreductase subunit E
VLSTDLKDKANALVDRYPVDRSALLPLLHLVQSQDGFVSDDGIAEIATLLALTKAEVNAVATFYSMYKRAPMGRHLVSVCTNFSCKVRGAQDVYDRLSATLGVGHNGTTEDGAITLEHAECLGNCDGAPVVSVDYLNYECLAPDQAVALVSRVRSGDVPPPTRGFPSPGIREIEHRLAGLGPVHQQDGEPAWVVCTASAERPAGTTDAPPPEDPGSVQGAVEAETASEEVADSGVPPDDVESQTAYSAREFPTSDQDAPGSEYPREDPRQDAQEGSRATDRDRDG